VIEINKCVVGPQVPAQFVSGDHFPNVFEQVSEHAKRLILYTSRSSQPSVLAWTVPTSVPSCSANATSRSSTASVVAPVVV
jgi:hypothetical protein